MNRMRLVEGRGNEYSPDGQHSEGDAFNTVFILDSTARPFFRAEQYHQFHNGIGAYLLARFGCVELQLAG